MITSFQGFRRTRLDPDAREERDVGWDVVVDDEGDAHELAVQREEDASAALLDAVPVQDPRDVQPRDEDLRGRTLGTTPN